MRAIIVDTNTDAIDVQHRRELLDWAQALGVDTARAMAAFVIIQNEHGWRACFSIKRQRDGHDYLDVNTGRIAVDYAAARIDIPEYGQWPSWLPRPMDLPELPAAHLLDALAAAHQFAGELRSSIENAEQCGVAQ